MREYRTREWKAFRAEVIRLDGGVCGQCGRGEADGVVLNVHHTRYIRGHRPWEYPFELCTTLCKGCHAAEHGLIPPKTGWECVGWDDLGELIGSCECCATALRYVFLVSHPDWPAMEVGTNCCDKLVGGAEANALMQQRQRRSDRLKRFVSSRKWFSFNDTHILHKDRLSVRIDPVSGGYRISFNLIPGRKLFPDVTAAKITAFDLIESGAAEAYLRRARSRG